MMPIELLSAEHRLIERMLAAVGNELARMESTQELDVEFMDDAVDFVRTYADRTHHGKEEEILFRELGRKNLSAAHRAMVKDLTKEHEWERKQVTLLVAAEELYLEGSKDALRKVAEILRGLLKFYPEHIRKEDEELFPASMEYFSEAEKDRMLAEMAEFDRAVIHEKYRKIVESMEAACG